MANLECDRARESTLSGRAGSIAGTENAGARSAGSLPTMSFNVASKGNDMIQQEMT
jgi:hypothetical protein